LAGLFELADGRPHFEAFGLSGCLAGARVEWTQPLQSSVRLTGCCSNCRRQDGIWASRLSCGGHKFTGDFARPFALARRPNRLEARVWRRGWPPTWLRNTR